MKYLYRVVSQKPLFVGLGICFIYLILHLFLMKDYGLSWDYHYHLYGGFYHLGIPVPSLNEPPPVPFTPPDPRLTVNDPFGPIMGVVPALSYQVFYTILHILPFDLAYNLPSVLYGVLGVGILFLFLYQALELRYALVAAVFLGLLPAYFGYLHVNMKDIPVAVMFCASIYLFWRLTIHKKIIDLILASIFFGITFSIKVNAIFIPIVCFVWVLMTYRERLFKKSMYIVLAYFVTSILAALILWWPFWADPLAKLFELKETFSHNTINMPVLLGGQIYRSGINIPFYYPYFYIAITTPVSLLVFFIIGLIFSIKSMFKTPVYLLLILWFFIPLSRFFLPSVGVIDGVRHFMEILFPFSAICAVGFVGTLLLLKKSIFLSQAVSTVFVVIFITSLVFPLVVYHPYQTSFYNMLVGGIQGANGKYDIDFWGTPQKEAMLWLNQRAPQNSFIHVIMAQSSAGVYLRDDLRERLNKKNIYESDYIVILNRQSFWNAEIQNILAEKIQTKKMVFVKSIDGVPLVWVARQ